MANNKNVVVKTVRAVKRNELPEEKQARMVMREVSRELDRLNNVAKRAAAREHHKLPRLLKRLQTLNNALEV